MKEPFPIHHHKDLSDYGIFLRTVTPAEPGNHRADYIHRDDYYMFGIMISGSLCMDIDFNQIEIKEGELAFIRPGQPHRFTSGDNFEAGMLMVECSMVSERAKIILEEASLTQSSAKTDKTSFEEIRTLYYLIDSVMEKGKEISVVRHLVSAFIGMVASCFNKRNNESSDRKRRHIEIVLQLNSLLQTHLTSSHAPSFYAGKLHISPIYLNEVVKNVTGLSIGNYIRSEIVARAKRLLYYTNLTVKEIALSLGFEDNAYFTRLFTKATGQSPLKFRAMNLFDKEN